MRIWWIPIALWIGMICYSAYRIQRRVTLLIFMATFGFFLLMKPILMGYFDYPGIGWAEEIQNHLVLVLSLGMLAIFIGYSWLPGLLSFFKREANAAGIRDSSEAESLRDQIAPASLIAFIATYLFPIVQLTNNIQTANEFGYTALFVDSSGGALASTFAYGSVVNTVVLYIYLATMPSRRMTFAVLLAAAIPRGLTLLTGSRGDFGMFLLVIFIYIVIRNRSIATRLMKPRTLFLAVLAGLAIILPIFIQVGLTRGVGASHSSLAGFLYGQGASLNVLEYGKEYATLLPDTNYLLWFTEQGLFRILFGGEGGLAGNSVEYALTGSSFSHAISYTVLGDSYLSGRGVGTSFLAETYASWAYIGVALVGLVYGLLLAWVDRFPLGHSISNALRLVILSSVIYAPRGSATGFLADLLSPTTLIVVLFIWILANLLRRRRPGERRQSPIVASSDTSGWQD